MTKPKTFRMVCLANSVRDGGRCIAGVEERPDGWGWVRPVGPDGREALLSWHYTTDDGTVPQPFDVVELPRGEACGSPAQPENYRLQPGTWRVVKPLEASRSLALVDDLTQDSDFLFGDAATSIQASDIQANGPGYSLTVVRPDQLMWELRARWNKPIPQLRASFTMGSIGYDLPVTDPVWFGHFREHELGIVDTSALATEGIPTHLTVSLGEAWEGRHYKIVAAVLCPT